MYQCLDIVRLTACEFSSDASVQTRVFRVSLKRLISNNGWIRVNHVSAMCRYDTAFLVQSITSNSNQAHSLNLIRWHSEALNSWWWCICSFMTTPLSWLWSAVQNINVCCYGSSQILQRLPQMWRTYGNHHVANSALRKFQGPPTDTWSLILYSPILLALALRKCMISLT